MTVGPLVVELCLVFAVAAALLHRYGDYKKQYILVTLGTLLAWYFSLTIVFVLPLDVSETLYRQCIEEASALLQRAVSSNSSNDGPAAEGNSTSGQYTFSTTALQPSRSSIQNQVLATGGPCTEPWTHVPEYLLPILWRIVYWSSQTLTWFILPFMQSYSNSGEFTVLGKLKAVLIANAIYYGTYMIVFCICLIYVATLPGINFDAQYLKTICVTASNTWGLFLLVLLLGYGLVDVPRSLWWMSRRGHSLQRAYFRLAKLSVEKSEAQEKLDDALEEVKCIAESVRYNNPLRKFVDTILLKCPGDFTRTLRRNDDYVDYASGSAGSSKRDGTSAPTLKSLVVLHKSVITAVRLSQRASRQWNALIEETCDLEDVAANEASSERSYRRQHGLKYTGPFRILHSARLEWYWKCRLRRFIIAAAACILAMCSIMVVWSECVFFVKEPALSLFAIFINASHSWREYFVTELISITIIAYLCVCAYSTVFKIRLFNYIYISPHHQTDEYSLIFSGTFLCRLTPPLCLNFLGLVRLDNHIISSGGTETAYTRIMGHLDVISFIANGFNIYFPIVVVVLCLATIFRLGARCLHCIGVQQFISNDDNVTQELVDEGRNLMRLERRRMERDNNREARRQDLQAMGVVSRSSASLAQPASSSSLGTAAASGFQMPQRNSSKAEVPQTKIYGSASRWGGKNTGRAIAEDRVELLGGPDDAVDFVADEGEGERTFNGAPQLRGAYGHSTPSTSVVLPPHRMFDDV